MFETEYFLNLLLDVSTYQILEIKPCGLGSRIRDMEAKSYKFIVEYLGYFLFL